MIDTIRTGVPDGLDELAHLGRTLHRRRADVLVYFDYRASNGPTEAINGRREALGRHALGFRNLPHYRIRSLLHCGNLTHAINALYNRKSRHTAAPTVRTQLVLRWCNNAPFDSSPAGRAVERCCPWSRAVRRRCGISP
ncbi:transposase [Rhodococcus sp. NPDC019627]|uniref:transposase n=1 Tax=unclassified Rhodococcus (in: high G+C Gram-positive bacteria) TaxID=192944 RepID=UPI0037AED729